MATNNMKLRFLCLVYRHGERAPVKFLPNDPNVGHWPDGAGNMTKKGQGEMYNLGRILRRRYDSFLGDKPHSRDVYVRSTDVDRCLSSAQCCLAGLYPPVDDDDRFSPDLNWQPVPVHTMPDSIDPFTVRLPSKYRHPAGGFYDDPSHDRLYQTMMGHQALYDRVDSLAETKGHFKHILMALDTMLVEKQENLNIPEEMEGRMADVKELFFACCQLYCVEQIESHRQTSEFLNELLKNIERFAANPSSTPRTFIYSLHDLNVIALIAVLTKELVRCPTASCLIFEVYEDTASEEFHLKILFLNKHDRAPREMKFLQKSSLVSVHDFKAHVRVHGHLVNNEQLVIN